MNNFDNIFTDDEEKWEGKHIKTFNQLYEINNFDPYNEEDWNEYDNVIDLFKLISSTELIFLTSVDRKKDFEDYLKNLFVGKTLYFKPRGGVQGDICVKVKDVECDSTVGYILDLIYLIDDNYEKHILPILMNNEIKIKNR